MAGVHGTLITIVADFRDTSDTYAVEANIQFGAPVTVFTQPRRRRINTSTCRHTTIDRTWVEVVAECGNTGNTCPVEANVQKCAGVAVFATTRRSLVQATNSCLTSVLGAWIGVIT